MPFNTHNFINALLNKKAAILITVTLVTVGLGYFITTIQVNNDPTQTIPPDLPELQAYEKLQNVFEAPRNILLIAEFNSLPLRAKIDSIGAWARRLNDLDGIENVAHLGSLQAPVSGGLFGLTGDYIVSRGNNQSTGQLRERIRENRAFTQPFISEDESVLSMILAVSDSVNQVLLVSNVMRLYDELNQLNSAQLYITGAPLYAYSIDKAMKRDFGILLPLCLAVVSILLYWVFRRIYYVIVSLLITAIALIWTFGFLGISGMPFSVVTAIIPVILFPVGVASAIHVFKTYQRLRQTRCDSPESAIHQAFAELLNPIFLSAVTTFVGFASFSFSDVIWTRTFGIFTAIGVALALLFSILLLPIFLAIDPQKNAAAKTHAGPGQPEQKSANRLLRLYRRFIQHNFAWAGILLVILVIGVTGFMRVRVEGNPIEMFPPQSIIRQSDNLISEHLGGTRFLTILLEHKKRKITSAQQWREVKQIRDYADSLSIVGNTSSLLPLLSRVSAMLSGSELSDASVSMILGANSLLGKKFQQFVDTWVSPDKQKTKIALICKNASGTRYLEASQQIENHIAREFPDWDVLVAGPPVLNDAMTYVLINTQVSSLALAFISVFAVLCILFRSVKVGAFAIVPIILSTAFVYALMGLFGVAINAITVIIVNTCIGIGIDYAIHFAAGYLYVRTTSGNRLDAIMATVRNKGAVIMFNTFVVGIGFLALAFSSFPPIRHFGVFVFISMAASSIFSLAFLPVLFRLFGAQRGDNSGQ